MLMYSDAEAHIIELKKLYEQIHKNDAPPANKNEKQAALVLESMKAMLMLIGAFLILPLVQADHPGESL